VRSPVLLPKAVLQGEVLLSLLHQALESSLVLEALEVTLPLIDTVEVHAAEITRHRVRGGGLALLKLDRVMRGGSLGPEAALLLRGVALLLKLNPTLEGSLVLEALEVVLPLLSTVEVHAAEITRHL
jgi:hypothetical protein